MERESGDKGEQGVRNQRMSSRGEAKDKEARRRRRRETAGERRRRKKRILMMRNRKNKEEHDDDDEEQEQEEDAEGAGIRVEGGGLQGGSYSIHGTDAGEARDPKSVPPAARAQLGPSWSGRRGTDQNIQASSRLSRK